jgi:hypothetical protein
MDSWGYVPLGNVALYKALEKSIKVKCTLEQATKALRVNRGPTIGVYGGARGCIWTCIMQYD